MMRALLALVALALGACSTEPLEAVADLAEQYAVAEVEADLAHAEAAQARAEHEAARADGARDAAEVEQLALEAQQAEDAAAAAEERELQARVALDVAKEKAAKQMGAAGGAVADVVPGLRALMPLGVALALWGAAALGNARAAKRAVESKGRPSATGPPRARRRGPKPVDAPR